MTDMPADPITPRRGLTLGLLSMSHAVVDAQSALMPLVYPLLITQFTLAERDIGLVIAITTAVGGTMQLSYSFLTRLIARPLLLAGGQLIFGASLLAAGLSTSIAQLVAAVSAARVGSSPQHPVGNGILSDAFPPNRRGFAISAHVAGGNLGTILVPFVAGGGGPFGIGLLSAVGWQVTLALFGVPALIIGVLIALLVREDGRAYRAAARGAGSVADQVRLIAGRQDLRLIMGAALIAAGGRGLAIVAPFMLLYLRGPLGIDAPTTSLLYALLLVGAVVGPLPAGWLSDRFGRRRILVIFYTLSAVGILSFLAAGSNLILLAPLMLPFGTAVFSESPVLQAYLADRATGPIRDVAFSVYFTLAFGIGAVWAIVIGNVVSAWGYPMAFVVMAASYLAAATFLVAVPGTGR
jgi:MFS family permease